MTARRRAVMLVVGTRPEAIKMCPLVRELREVDDLRPVVASTGQHAAMLEEVLKLFDVEPDTKLEVHQPGLGLAEVAARCLSGLSEAMRARRPDAVVVQGDTTTTLAGALAAYYQGIPLVHLEAGLRSGDPKQPFPEEANRRMVTTMTDLHLAATPRNRDRLLAEGVRDASIAVVGNTVIDALLQTTSEQRSWRTPALAHLAADARPLVLVTAHRRENWGEPLQRIATALANVARRRPDVLIVWPMHANPAIQRVIRAAASDIANVVLTGPLGYAEFSALMKRATVVLTDSGGVQEEAPALGKPVLVLREVTERQEAVEAGTATLIGTDAARVAHLLEQTLAAPTRPAWSPYGDGHASVRAVAAIQAMLGIGNRLPDYHPLPSRPAPRASLVSAG